MPKQEHVYLSWDAQEFRHYEKNTAWYITLIVIAALMVGFEVIQKDLFGALSIAIITIFVIFFARIRPRVVHIHLTNRGIRMGEDHIPHTAARHFWVVDNEQHKTLNVETNAYLNHLVIIQIADQDPDTIREILRQHIPEAPQEEETFAQRIMHHFRF